ncbi:MAG: FtsX-like permease family protein [Anaerolineales bacterium]|nr:FtsX-like permease family protein [Anaerolineales bacterium]
MVIFRYLLRRIVRHWQLFLPLSLGVILGTTLLASGPLLVDTVMEFGLRHKLLTADPFDRNLNLQTYERAEIPFVAVLDSQMRTTLGKRLGKHIEQIILSIDSTWMIPWLDGQPVMDQRVNLAFYEGIEAHVELIDGAWPSAIVSQADSSIPVVVGEALALAYELQVGDRLPLSRSLDETQPSRWLHVSGVVRPRDPGEDYWFAEFNPLRPARSEHLFACYSAILLVEPFFHGMATLLPGTESRLTWHVRLAPDSLSVAEIPGVYAQIAALKTLAFEQHHFLLNTGAPELLNGFLAQARATRIPLYVLAAEIFLLVLYYAIMVAELSAQQNMHEFAMLHSRGASAMQIFAIQAAEASLVCILALLSGPALAGLLLRGIVDFSPLSGLRSPDWVVSLPRASWLAACVGAAVCALGMLLPVGPVLRRSILGYQRSASRPSQTPWWQQFYLDVIMLFLGMILLWRLHLHGGIAIEGAYRGEIDWLLLLSPLVLLLGSATILLRIFPLILQLSARLVALGRSLPSALALWQTSRNPAQVALLVLLLTLATSLAILSTGLNATLDISELERAQYATGSDLRIVSSQVQTIPSLANEPGVRAAMSAVRGEGTVDLGSFQSFPKFDVLAIDPMALPVLSAFRDDFADRPAKEMLARLVMDDSPFTYSLALPGRPASLGLWVWCIKDENRSKARYWWPLRGESDLDRVKLSAKLLTAQGRYLSFALEAADPPAVQTSNEPSASNQAANDLGEWRFFAARLLDMSPGAYPLRLHSIWFDNFARTIPGERAVLDMEFVIDDLVVVDSVSGEMLIAEGFEDSSRSWALNALDSFVSQDAALPIHSGHGNRKLFLAFDYTRRPIPLKVRSSETGSPGAIEAEEQWPEPALPALVSPSFLKAAHLELGDTASVWINSLPPLEIQLTGLVNYFPTLYENLPNGSLPKEAGFAVVAYDSLLARLNDRSPAPVNVNEIWLSTAEQLPTGKLALLESLADRVWALESVHTSIKADPMGLGLRSVTKLGYLTTALLSVVGFTTHFYMSARRREVSYGVLRSMGLSSWQLYATLILEQMILILSGLALGVLLGLILNSLVLPGLPVTLGDLPPVPPFRVHNDWAASGRIFLALGCAFLVSISLVTALLWRARLHRIMRIGEE